MAALAESVLSLKNVSVNILTDLIVALSCISNASTHSRCVFLQIVGLLIFSNTRGRLDGTRLCSQM